MKKVTGQTLIADGGFVLVWGRDARRYPSRSKGIPSSHRANGDCAETIRPHEARDKRQAGAAPS